MGFLWWVLWWDGPRHQSPRGRLFGDWDRAPRVSGEGPYFNLHQRISIRFSHSHLLACAMVWACLRFGVVMRACSVLILPGLYKFSLVGFGLLFVLLFLFCLFDFLAATSLLVELVSWCCGGE